VEPRRRIASEAWYGLFTQALDKVVPVAIVLYLARTLAPEQFGVYSFLVAYLAFFQIAAEHSLDTVTVRMVSQAPERRLAIFHAVLGLRIVSALVAAAVAIVLGGPVSGGLVPPGLLVLASVGLVTAMGGAFRALFRADLNIRAVLMLSLARAIALLLFVVAAMSLWPGLYAVFAAIAAANLASFVVIAAVVGSEIPLRVAADRALWKLLARGALPLAVNALAITISLRAGLVILMSLRGPLEVGLLGAASRVVEGFTVLPEALMITIYPLMAGLHENDAGRLIATAGKSVRYLAMTTGVLVVVCAVAGREVMHVLFGSSFAEAGPVLGLLGAMALLSATGTVILNVLVAVHRETLLYRNTLVFALVNVVICLPLIDRHGYAGAAVAMVLTSAASQISLAVIPSTRAYVLPCLTAAARSFVAVGLGVGVGLMSGRPAPMACGLGIAAYLVFLVVLGVLNRDEVRFIRSLFGTGSAEARG
jgi:O-antigen/teichoic acid export membrane protein